jgi:hypothetical protein
MKVKQEFLAQQLNLGHSARLSSRSYGEVTQVKIKEEENVNNLKREFEESPSPIETTPVKQIKFKTNKNLTCKLKEGKLKHKI